MKKRREVNTIIIIN